MAALTDRKLSNVRIRFVESVSKAVISTLLDDLLERRVLNEEEVEEVRESCSKKSDQARCLIDGVRKKGARASEIFIERLCFRDVHLASELGLRPPSGEWCHNGRFSSLCGAACMGSWAGGWAVQGVSHGRWPLGAPLRAGFSPPPGCVTCACWLLNELQRPGCCCLGLCFPLATQWQSQCHRRALLFPNTGFVCTGIPQAPDSQQQGSKRGQADPHLPAGHQQRTEQLPALSGRGARP